MDGLDLVVGDVQRDHGDRVFARLAMEAQERLLEIRDSSSFLDVFVDVS
jgi:hypothetical protein